MNDISTEHQLLDSLNPVSGLKPQVAFIFAVSLLMFLFLSSWIKQQHLAVAFIFAVSLLMFLFLSSWIKQQHLAVFILYIYKKLPLQAYKPKLSKSRHYEHSWKTLRASY